MKIEKAYCETCDSDVSFYIEEFEYSTTIRNVDVTATLKRARCSKCNTIVYPVSIGRENDIALYDAYKKKVGLLTSGEIIAMRKEMKLSQTKFAEIVRCGAKTIARYENGAIQDPVLDQCIRLTYEYYKSNNCFLYNSCPAAKI